MNWFLAISGFGFLSLTMAAGWVAGRAIYLDWRRDQALRSHPTLMNILHESMDVAFAKILRDHVIVNSASGFKIGKEDLDKHQRIYVKLVLQVCGPSVVRDLVRIHGDMDSFCLAAINDMVIKVEEVERQIMDVNAKIEVMGSGSGRELPKQ